MNWKLFLAAVIMALILWLPAFAEESESVEKIDEVIVKSTKIERKPEHMTDSVTVISEEDIKLQSFTDMTEILRFTPSVEFKQAGGPGQFSYPKMRGYGQGHFLVLVNGMKINEAYSAGIGNFIGQLDTKLLQSVEVLRGPQAALYGSDTTAGIISFTTIGGKPGKHINAGAEYGSLNWKKGYSSIRGGTVIWDYAFGVAYTDSNGVHDDEYYRNFSPTFKLGWHPDTIDIELAYLYVKSEFQAAELNEPSNTLNSRSEHWSFQTPDPNNANEYKHQIATLNASHQINDYFRHKLLLGWFEKEHYRNDRDDGLLGYESAPFNNFTFDGVTYNAGEAVPIYDEGTGEAYGYDNRNLMADYNLIWDSRLGDLGSNSTLFGLEYYYQEGGKWGRYGDVDSNNYNYSFYINDQLLLLKEALVLSAGLRRDEHEAYGTQTTGKIGSAYTFFNMGTTLFTNYGTSFRAPTFSNLYDPSYGNEDIDPETGWTVEGGLRQELMNGRIDAEVTYWYSELDDVIVFDYTIPNSKRPSGFGEYGNRDSAETSGVEFAFGAHITDHINLKGNYTYTNSNSENDGERFRTVQIARNKGNLSLSYVTDEYAFGVTGYYSGPRLRWKGDIEMKEYYRVDLFGRYEILKGVNLYGRIENLTDEDIEEGLGYEQPGFYGIIGIEYLM
ncbi:MAG: TonB-dependent receptor [Proteobacteria bacterium]|nr:TonB-dependent receptor [Pseudomonadota bacterium]